MFSMLLELSKGERRCSRIETLKKELVIISQRQLLQVPQGRQERGLLPETKGHALLKGSRHTSREKPWLYCPDSEFPTSGHHSSWPCTPVALISTKLLRISPDLQAPSIFHPLDCFWKYLYVLITDIFVLQFLIKPRRGFPKQALPVEGRFGRGKGRWKTQVFPIGEPWDNINLAVWAMEASEEDC